MIELPEAQVLAKQMRETLVGKVIAQVQTLQTPHGFAWFLGDAKDYEVLLHGQTIADTMAFGGRPELRFGNGMRFSFGDGVNLRHHAAGTKLPAKHQLLLQFEDDSALVGTVQMYGFFSLFVDEDSTHEDGYYRVAAESISPLTDEFDFDYFTSLRAQCKETLSCKAFLATQQRVPGLGNGVLQDILWQAQLHPKRKLSTLSPEEFQAMFAATKQILADMTAQGGRNTEKDLFGQPGGYTTIMSRTAPACPACTGIITRKAYLGGNVYYCESCQKES
ncbi:MAG: endonuclease VIII [Oscillospiraceae bacterium]|nr:endonuclease VIII [Oscillospiraceae bacterium]